MVSLTKLWHINRISLFVLVAQLPTPSFQHEHRPLYFWTWPIEGGAIYRLIMIAFDFKSLSIWKFNQVHTLSYNRNLTLYALFYSAFGPIWSVNNGLPIWSVKENVIDEDQNSNECRDIDQALYKGNCIDFKPDDSCDMDLGKQYLTRYNDSEIFCGCLEGWILVNGKCYQEFSFAPDLCPKDNEILRIRGSNFSCEQNLCNSTDLLPHR